MPTLQRQVTDLSIRDGGEPNSSYTGVSGIEESCENEWSESSISESSSGSEEGDSVSSLELRDKGPDEIIRARMLCQQRVDTLSRECASLWEKLGGAADSYEGYGILSEIDAIEDKIRTELWRLHRYRTYSR
jgi:hypothetical protein